MDSSQNNVTAPVSDIIKIISKMPFLWILEISIVQEISGSQLRLSKENIEIVPQEVCVEHKGVYFISTSTFDVIFLEKKIPGSF